MGSSFVSPIVKGSIISVRIDGVIIDFKLRSSDANKVGWFIFQPTDFKFARIIDEADSYTVEEYKKLFKKVRFIAADPLNDDGDWIVFPFGRGSFNMELGKDGYQVIHLVDGLQVFDTVTAIFDGNNFWFDSVDMNQDMSMADYLREELKKHTLVKNLKYKGLTPEQKGTYAFLDAYHREKEKELRKQTLEGRILEALQHADAKLHKYMEQKDAITISWVSRSGGQYTSTVKKDSLRVLSSGVCLSGKDADFDLASLVSVMEEREKRGDKAPGFRRR